MEQPSSSMAGLPTVIPKCCACPIAARGRWATVEARQAPWKTPSMPRPGRVALFACAVVTVASAMPSTVARAATPWVTNAVRTRADFNGDGYDDLFVAAPGESTGAVANTGAITVIPGGAAGLVGASATTF